MTPEAAIAVGYHAWFHPAYGLLGAVVCVGLVYFLAWLRP